ncbi:MAG: bifunctional nuclease family protein [Candidatus Limnocylindrus sp.]
MDLRRAVVEGVRVQMLSGTHILLLRDAEERRYLPIPIGPHEANAIAYHLQGVRPERPLTHDIATLMMNALGAELREDRIIELRDETFRARMLVAPTGGAVQELDARPSDAVALALRANAPIFISLDLLAAQGIVPEAAEEERLSLFRDFVNSLDSDQPNDAKGGDSER